MAHRKYRIHPGIGIARLGNSPDKYFVGPEAPGILPVTAQPGDSHSSTSKYKDEEGRIKRQGARFRIYEYTYDDADALTGVRELTADDGDIEWSVHLANRKAAADRFVQEGRRNEGIPEQDLVIDAQTQHVSGKNAPMVRLAGAFRGTEVPLGDLLTDGDGRLVVLGGFGASRPVPAGLPIHHFANNEGWCDDISDGPVKARVRLKGTSHFIDAVPAWVVAAPPDYAPPIENAISLYDVVFDQMVRLHPDLDLSPDMPVSFTKHIYPILRRTVSYIWVSNLARRGHEPGTEAYFLEPHFLQELANNETLAPDHDHGEPMGPEEQRRHVFGHLRNPQGGGGDMPMLNALDAQDPVALTGFQYKLMERWADGDFESDWTGTVPAPVPLEQLAPADQPSALDRAALEAGVGGGFFPGIEIGRIVRDPSTYDPDEPFRLSSHLKAGAMTEHMAVPWQADFRDCGSGWWPAQRPNQVLRGRSAEPQQWIPNAWKRETMVKRWAELGFIVKRRSGGKDRYVERERNF